MKPIKWHSKYYTSSENLREFLYEIDGDPRFVPIIKALENKNEDVRREAIDSICYGLKFMTRGSKEQLAGQTNNQYAPSYEEAHRHNSSVQYCDKVVELFIKALNDEGAFVRNAAAEHLGKIGDKKAVEPLIKALKDKAIHNVRGTAAEALGKIGDKRAVEPLIRALKVKSNEKSARASAASALGYFGKRAAEGLLEALQDDIPYTLYHYIYKSLINIAKENTKGEEKDNVMKFLKSNDHATIQMGASMLKGILEE